MFILVLILLFIWALMMQMQTDGFKIKKLGKTITKGVSKTTNQVGGSIAKMATSALGSNAKMVIKNMRPIKKAIASFIKKGGSYKSSAIPASIGLVARKCGML